MIEDKKDKKCCQKWLDAFPLFPVSPPLPKWNDQLFMRQRVLPKIAEGFFDLYRQIGGFRARQVGEVRVNFLGVECCLPEQNIAERVLIVPNVNNFPTLLIRHDDGRANRAYAFWERLAFSSGGMALIAHGGTWSIAHDRGGRREGSLISSLRFPAQAIPLADELGVNRGPVIMIAMSGYLERLFSIDLPGVGFFLFTVGEETELVFQTGEEVEGHIRNLLDVLVNRYALPLVEENIRAEGVMEHQGVI
jgi:hypothetical protein